MIQYINSVEMYIFVYFGSYYERWIWTVDSLDRTRQASVFTGVKQKTEATHPVLACTHRASAVLVFLAFSIGTTPVLLLFLWPLAAPMKP
jgi:hypothetical protein